jgi:hypothetical protein
MALDPKITQEDILRKQDILSRDNINSQLDLQKVDINVIKDNIPSDFKPKGADQFTLTVLDKSDDLKGIILPKILGLGKQLGIEGLNTANPTYPNKCPNPELINKILKIRDNIVGQLNSIAKFLNAGTKTFTGLSTLSQALTTTTTTLDITRKVISLAVKFVPSPPGTPGVVTSGLSDLKDLLDKIDPRLKKANTYIGTLSIVLALISSIILKVIDVLNKLDFFLKKCGATLAPLDQSLLDLEEINKNIDKAQQTSPDSILYKGFTLEIVKKPYNNKVNQNIGVAKNQYGIILLQTNPSFTTTPQVLIDELKLIIDRDNLKAY